MNGANANIVVIQGVDLTQNLAIQAAFNQANVTVGVDATQNNRITIIEGVNSTQNTSIATANTPAGLDTQVQFNDGGIRAGSSLLTFNKTSGILNTKQLSVTNSVGDEGGEILLAKPESNTTLVGTGITIDAYQNKIRFFEQGGSARGAYIDLTECVGGAGTNLLSGGAGSSTDQFARNTANSASSNTVVIQGVDLTQNTNITFATGVSQGAYNQANVTVGVDNTQNSNITIIQGVDLTQNTRIQAAFDRANVTVGVDNTQNSNITIIQGVDLTQNTQIQASFNRANSSALSSGYTPNTILFANTSGNIVSSGLIYYASNTSLIVPGEISSNTIILDSANTGFPTGQLYSSSYITGSLSQVTIDSFALATYRSAEYFVQITSGTSYHIIKLILVHDGTNVYLSQYAEILAQSSLGTFDASVSGSNVILQFTPTNATSTVKLTRTAIVV